MIREIEHYHGGILSRLIRGGGEAAVRVGVHPRFRSAYVLADEVGVYAKYSTSRLSPWTFGFKTEHRNEVARLRGELAEVFVALACGLDGVVCLDGEEFLQLGSGGSIRVARGPRQKYAVSCGDRKGLMRIGDNEFPAKVYAAVRRAAKRRGQARGEASA